MTIDQGKKNSMELIYDKTFYSEKDSCLTCRYSKKENGRLWCMNSLSGAGQTEVQNKCFQYRKK